MKRFGLWCALAFLGCEKIDYIELAPAEVTFKQLNNQTWMEAKCMARNGVRAVKARVGWSVANPAVAKVDGKGQLTPVGDGETEVIAKVGDVEARARVEVILVDHIEVEPKELKLQDGAEAVKVIVKAFRKNGKLLTDRSVALISSDKNVAQIVGDGAILPLEAGTADVSVQVDGAKALVKVIVDPSHQKR